jgi:hypothetical protein
MLSLSSALAVFLTTTQIAFAVPPVPLNLYGIVKLNGLNVPLNTLIVGKCDGQVYGQTTEITLYNGDTWYGNLDVEGDDPETPAKDGCYPGETVSFEIADTLADQTTPWAGTSYQFNLTATIAPPCYFADVHPNADHSHPASCDGDVDIADVERIAGCWMQSIGPACPATLDLDLSGAIDTLDLATVAGEWGWPNF